MSDGPRPPPAANRFRKGQSGNPKGRPKTAPALPASAFDIVIDRTLTITQNGKPRELTVEEALQHRTYQDCHCRQPPRPAGGAEDDRQA